MTRIKNTFNELRDRRHKAVVMYIMAGDPDLDTTRRLIHAAQAAGTDVLELGMPFSDPLADGATIQAAGQRALKHEFDVLRLLELVKQVREEGVSIPLIIMAYYNTLFVPGLSKVFEQARVAGLDGWIVPDLPLEESARMIDLCQQSGMDFVPLIAPTTPRQRISRIAEQATGMIYYVSRLGITGTQQSLPDNLVSHLTELKSVTEVPVVVGFGISTPEQARVAASAADGVVTGSALVTTIHHASQSGADPCESARRFIEGFAAVCHQE